MLRTVTHDADRRMWCGPTAISAVTGAPTSKVFALADADRQARIDKGTWSIMGRSRSRSVKGMAHGELVNVLRALGHRVTLLVSNTTSKVSKPVGANDRNSSSAAIAARSGAVSPKPPKPPTGAQVQETFDMLTCADADLRDTPHLSHVPSVVQTCASYEAG